MIKELLSSWPVIRQILSGGDGTGVEAMSARTRNLRPRHESAEVARSVCPYCAVGCGQLVYHKNGKLISIEGDPASFVSAGGFAPSNKNAISSAGLLVKVCLAICLGWLPRRELVQGESR